MSAHDDFKKGFLKGYASVKGTSQIPPIPPTPSLPAGSTYSDLGFKLGVEAAKK